jgi:curved DNA-binding protein CbpA
MQTTKNLYKLLELPKEASQEQIRQAHRELVRKYHPDTNPEDPQAEERFKEVQQAYEVLSDPQKRREYDQRLRASSRTGGTVREGAGTTRTNSGRPRQRETGRRAGETTTYTVDLSELLTRLTNLSSERSSGRTGGTFQLRGEEIAQLAKALGEEVSRISELWGKDTAELLRRLNEQLKRNAKTEYEGAPPDSFSATYKESLDEKPLGTSSRKPREKKVKGPKAQEKTKRVKGPRARRNESRKRNS